MARFGHCVRADLLVVVLNELGNGMNQSINFFIPPRFFSQFHSLTRFFARQTRRHHGYFFTFSIPHVAASDSGSIPEAKRTK